MRRPAEDERELLEEAELDLERGLVGDDWHARGSKSTGDGSSNRMTQLTLANARAVDLVAAGDRERWALAGDQFYVDFDISEANLPAGHAARARNRRDRGDRAAARRLRQVQRPLRQRRAPVREHQGAPPPAPARDQREVVEPGTVRRGDAIRKL